MDVYHMHFPQARSRIKRLISIDASMTPDWPPKLTVEPEQVVRLFTGDRFYSSADAGIREAVLNAIDAIGRRRNVEADVNPQIHVIYDRQEQEIDGYRTCELRYRERREFLDDRPHRRILGVVTR